mmetsp:Transcript_65966/g.206684  ORF Transcript_65966/g.206684 Transcript_65966/m.206684 type:complete len:225 (+) Transcript_65966:3-677(+)
MAAAAASSGSSAGMKRQTTGTRSFPEPLALTAVTMPLSAKAMGSGWLQLNLISSMSCVGVLPTSCNQLNKPNSLSILLLLLLDCLPKFPLTPLASATALPGKRLGGMILQPEKLVHTWLAYRTGHSKESVRTCMRHKGSRRDSFMSSERKGPAAKSLCRGMVSKSRSSSSSTPVSCVLSISETQIWEKLTSSWACNGLIERGVLSIAHRAPRRMPSEVTSGQPA